MADCTRASGPNCCCLTTCWSRELSSCCLRSTRSRDATGSSSSSLSAWSWRICSSSALRSLCRADCETKSHTHATKHAQQDDAPSWQRTSTCGERHRAASRSLCASLRVPRPQAAKGRVAVGTLKTTEAMRTKSLASRRAPWAARTQVWCSQTRAWTSPLSTLDYGQFKRKKL